MADDLRSCIEISRDTYEKIEALSEAIGLSMDSIIRELLSYPDSLVPSETLWINKSNMFYLYQTAGREALIRAGWSTHHDDNIFRGPRS